MAGRFKSRLPLLRRWREIANKVTEAVKRLYPQAEVYLIGGIAENRATINSDVDIAIVFKEPLDRSRRIGILTHIWEFIESEVPMYYPLEIHILEAKEFGRIRGRKVKLS